MRRALWFRLLATFVAVWLPLTVGEPAALSSCSAHFGVPTSDGGAHQGHLAAAPHSADVSSHHGSTSDGEHQCSCIAGCSASTAVVAVPNVHVATIVVAEHETAGPAPTATSRPRPSPDFARPHTTGPPRA